MTIKDVKDLKDKIYEIEGLLELAQLREEKLPELEPLICGRIKALMHWDEETAVEDTVTAVTEEVFAQTQAEPVEEPAPVNEDKEPSADELEEESGEEYVEEELPEEAFEVEPEMFEEEEETPEREEHPKPNGVITELFEESETVSVSRAQDDLELPEEPEIPVLPVMDMAPEPRVVAVSEPRFEKPQKQFSSTNKPAFTLNDRFRFRRELFGNSDVEYSAAMDLIASMENYEEAEEYFLDELGWDIENSEVKDFMDILRKYFS